MNSNQSVEILIDWITITKPDLELSGEREVSMLLHDYDGSEVFESYNAPVPYRYGVKNEFGATGASAKKGQGTILTWSGSALQKTNALSIGQLAVANDWRVTRLDCTVDFLGFETAVEDYLQEYKHGQAQTTARTHDNHTSENGGHTVYLGSWDSNRYLRIYNKTASEARFTDISTLPEKWLRCELVLRAEHARSALGFIVNQGIRVAIPALLRGYCDFPNVSEYAAMADLPLTTIGKGKVDSNRQKWLMERVLPTLMQELQRDKEFEAKFMGQLMKHLGY